LIVLSVCQTTVRQAHATAKTSDILSIRWTKQLDKHAKSPPIHTHFDKLRRAAKCLRKTQSVFAKRRVSSQNAKRRRKSQSAKPPGQSVAKTQKPSAETQKCSRILQKKGRQLRQARMQVAKKRNEAQGNATKHKETPRYTTQPQTHRDTYNDPVNM